jgi:hypothetical protein
MNIREIGTKSNWSFRLIAAALAFVAMVLPRLPGFRLNGVGEARQPIGPFSGWLTDGNVGLMSGLLIGSAAVMTWLWPARVQQSVVIIGLAPAVWTVILLMLHGWGEGYWIIALAFAAGYGGILAVTGAVLVKSLAWLRHEYSRSR